MNLTKHFCLYICCLLPISNTFGGVGTLTGGSRNGMISKADSWSKIIRTVRSEDKLKLKGDYAYVGQIVSLFDVCTDGRNFKTTRKLPVYKSVKVSRSQDDDGRRDSFKNVIVGHEFRTYPLNTTQRKVECDHNDRNCKTVEKDFNQEIEKEISVFNYVRETRGSEQEKIYKKLFNKKYHVPNCE
jgi:hypothetical protein